MKCQKCAKPAVVHLTELLHDSSGAKRAVEIHLCLGHAAEAGLISLETGAIPANAGDADASHKQGDAVAGEKQSPTAIVPAPGGGGLTVVRPRESPGDRAACPVCGETWTTFKTTGLMGCAHDYDMFESKLTPLLRRAQEGAADHVGKVPRKKQSRETDRQVASLRLRRELQKALDAENYEQAARLRDQLRTLEN